MTLLLFGAQVAPSASAKLVDPKEYAIKRFNEVVAASEEKENVPDLEKLISIRARLAIAERRLQDLKTTTSTPATEDSKQKIESFKPQMLKAIEAEIDHYKRQISSLEANVVLQELHQTPKRHGQRNRSYPQK